MNGRGRDLTKRFPAPCLILSQKTLWHLSVFFPPAFLLPPAVTSALIDPGRHVVIRQGIHAPGLLREFPEVPAYLLVGYLRIDLRGAYTGMPHHFADGLNRHAVGEADLGRIGMPCHIVGQTAVQPAYLPDDFQATAQTAGGRHMEQLTARALPPVLLYYPQRNIQQFDTTFHLCLLTVDVYPFGAVRGCDDMSFGQLGHLGPSQSGECRKDEKVSRMAQPVSGKIGRHHHGELLTCQVPVKYRGDLELVTGKRIT